MRSLLLLLVAFAISANSVHVATGGPRSLLAASRKARCSHVMATPQDQPGDDEAPVKPMQPFATGAPSGLQDLVLDSPMDKPLDPNNLEEMRAKVLLFQKELDAQREELDMEDEELEKQLGFFGEPIGDFIVNAFKSIPEYEVPPPAVLTGKILLSIFGFAFALVFIKCVDVVVLELFRPYVQYKVSGLPSLPL